MRDDDLEGPGLPPGCTIFGAEHGCYGYRITLPGGGQLVGIGYATDLHAVLAAWSRWGWLERTGLIG